MFPNGMLEKFRKTVSEDEYYEILLLESVLGISMSNYDEAVGYICQAISRKPYLKSSLERLVKDDIIYSFKVTNRLISDFKLNEECLEEPDYKCFEEDDVDGYIKFSLEHSKSALEAAIDAIIWDDPKILKHIISRGLNASDLQKLGEHALVSGNIEIIRILEQNGVNYENYDLKQFDLMNHYDIIEWLVTNYGNDSKPHSFEVSLMRNPDIEHYNIVLKYDLPSIFDMEYLEEDRKSVVKDLIEYGCINTISKIDNYICSDLLYCVIRYQKDIFNVIFSKIDDVMLPCENGLNILQSAILTSNIDFVKPIVEKNHKILFLRDRLKNNILHFCARQHSKEVFKYIISELSVKAQEMIIEKNKFEETPLDLLKRYDLMYFMTNSENPNEYRPIDHPENYQDSSTSELITLFSNTHARRSFDYEFENVYDSNMFKFIDTRSITKAANMFSSLRDSECLKYLNISRFKSFAELFERFEGFSIEVLKGWDVKNIEDMSAVFKRAYNIEDFTPISDWNVSKVQSFERAFKRTSLTNLSAFSKWNVRKDADFSQMFAKCKSLVDCSGIDSWDLSENDSVVDMFLDCDNIKRFPKWYKKALERIEKKKL